VPCPPSAGSVAITANRRGKAVERTVQIFLDAVDLPRNELLAAIQRIQRIQRVLSVPLTVDLEDGAQASSLLADKIAAARRALGSTHLFISARTDVYLRGLATGDAAISMALDRAAQYQTAGADGLFVPGMSSVQDTTRVAGHTPLPLNLMLLPGMPAIPDLFAAGARRFTAGPAKFQGAHGHARKLAHALVVDHSTDGLFANALGYDTMNALFTG
jgi:2-methylisocitrate lyase-like PEP mutase family enzyme